MCGLATPAGPAAREISVETNKSIVLIIEASGVKYGSGGTLLQALEAEVVVASKHPAAVREGEQWGVGAEEGTNRATGRG